MDRPKFTIILFLLVTLFLLLLRTFVIIELGTLNYEYVEYQKRLDDIKRENSLLREQLLYETSLIEIEQKAKDRGFIHSNYRSHYLILEQ